MSDFKIISSSVLGSEARSDTDRQTAWSYRLIYLLRKKILKDILTLWRRHYL